MLGLDNKTLRKKSVCEKKKVSVCQPITCHHSASTSEKGTVVFLDSPERQRGTPLSVSGRLFSLMFLPMGLVAGHEWNTSTRLMVPNIVTKMDAPVAE